MTKYEILLLLDPDLDDGRQGEIVGRVRELVEKGGGSWDLHDTWGRRKLAYEIGHKSEGHYHLLHFTSEAATLDEISRVLRIDDGVMRHMATRRIEGSPARPVAASVPTRQDEGVDGRSQPARTPAPSAASSPAAEPVNSPATSPAISERLPAEVEEEEE